MLTSLQIALLCVLSLCLPLLAAMACFLVRCFGRQKKEKSRREKKGEKKKGPFNGGHKHPMVVCFNFAAKKKKRETTVKIILDQQAAAAAELGPHQQENRAAAINQDSGLKGIIKNAPPLREASIKRNGLQTGGVNDDRGDGAYQSSLSLHSASSTKNLLEPLPPIPTTSSSSSAMKVKKALNLPREETRQAASLAQLEIVRDDERR